MFCVCGGITWRYRAGQHIVYWSQFPGEYEHWRFEEGFATGWDDAYLFACKWARLQSPFVEEVGFKGPWMYRRKEEHLHREVMSKNVWECGESYIPVGFGLPC